MGSRLESNSKAVRKRIETHEFNDEEGEEYKGSRFGGFSDYFRRKKIKLQNLDVELRARSTDKPTIFRGIVCHVNGYTQPSLNDLHHLIVTHGGGFMQYLDGKTTVTHIIASSLTPKKAVEFKKYRIVKPAWIVDSVNAGKLLPWDDYRVVDEGHGQKVLQFDNGKIVSQINNKARGYRDQTETSWYTSQLATAATRDTNSQLLSSSAANNGKADDQEEPLPPANPALIDDPEEMFENDDIADEEIHLDAPQPLNMDLVAEREPYEHNFVDSGEAQDADEDPETVLNMPPSPPLFEESSDALPLSPQSASKNANLTAEEHNTILLSDPRMRKSSVLNPDFLDQYYRESRLHHLSTWKADLKSQLQARTAEQSASQKARQKRATGARRYILHVDFDSFFVAVSLKNHPQYIDKPACVAHGSGPGSEIASCNYPAREFGVKNGMWMRRAREMCKELKILPYDFPAYEEASRFFYDAVLATGGIVQSVSIDEALVDITHLCLPAGGTDGTTIREGSIWREQEQAESIATKLREQVKQQTGCAISVGIGENILLAKVALRKAKPAGQYQITPEEILEFVGRLEVRDLPGVAYSIGGKLEEIGVRFVKDIRELSKEKLLNILGPKTGEKLWNYARGIDKTEVGEQVVRKSVSAEVNWGVRFETQEQAEEFVESLCGELNRRLLKERVKGKQLTMKIMRRSADAPRIPPKHLGHGKCDTFNKSVALGVATNTKEALAKEALTILRHYGFSPGELRGLGVQMTKLEPLKSTETGVDSGSQMRLQFKAGIRKVPGESPGSAQPLVTGETNDNGVHQQDQQPKGQPQADSKMTQHHDNDHLETPKKSKPSLPLNSHISAFNGSTNSPSRKPLNTLGTQFILPTQADPDVLAELPADIRSRLSKHARLKEPEPKSEPEEDAHSKVARISGTILPNQSQLDPETLDALPEDVREEILAHYSSSPSRHSAQALLPQSPRPTRTLPPSRKPSRGRPKGGSLLSRLKNTGRGGNVSTLTQSNFVAGQHQRSGGFHPVTDSDDAGSGENGNGDEKEIAPDFLEALPEDIRREVIAQHRAEQLKRTAGIEVSKKRGTGRLRQNQQQERKAGETLEVSTGSTGQKERVLVLPPRTARPTFTTKKLWRIEDLRDAVSLWYDEFRDDGPYQEDVDALGKYLQSVVGEESDMAKAVAVVSWMEWVVGNEGTAEGTSNGLASDAKTKWNEALERARVFMQDSVRARGLGSVSV